MIVFTNKRMLKKVIIALLLMLVLFQFFLSPSVQAADLDEDVLFQPIMTLFVSIGDVVMAVVQDVLMQTNR